MAYSITPKDRSATKALRRIARERLEDSVALVDADRMPRVALIHELRKNVKKTRALLRLVRPGFDAYARENAALRDAGRMLSDLRDADVLAQSFDNVATRVYMPPEALAALRDRVIAAPIAARDPDAVLKAHAEAIVAATQALKEKRYGRGCRDLARAIDTLMSEMPRRKVIA